MRPQLQAIDWGIIALYGVNEKAMARWKDAFIDVKDRYWERRTQLVVKVLAQPGDRIKEFKTSSDGAGEYKHPRGSDLTLLIEGPLGKNEQGYPEYRHRQSGIVMVRLPGGTFLMGSPKTEEGRQDREGPQHKVTLSPFMIAKREVTQAQWQSIMGDNPSHFRGRAQEARARLLHEEPGPVVRGRAGGGDSPRPLRRRAHGERVGEATLHRVEMRGRPMDARASLVVRRPYAWPARCRARAARRSCSSGGCTSRNMK